MDDLMKILDGLGADRTTIYTDIGVGFAATEKLYIILSSAAFADGLYYQNESIIMTSVLSSAGIRYYPFVTGMQLGAEVEIGSLTVEVQARKQLKAIRKSGPNSYSHTTSIRQKPEQPCSSEDHYFPVLSKMKLYWELPSLQNW